MFQPIPKEFYCRTRPGNATNTPFFLQKYHENHIHHFADDLSFQEIDIMGCFKIPFQGTYYF